MAIEVPSEKFDNRKMFSSVSELSTDGFRKAQDAQTRITEETMRRVYLAGYKQCMEDYGLEAEEKPQVAGGLYDE